MVLLLGLSFGDRFTLVGDVFVGRFRGDVLVGGLVEIDFLLGRVGTVIWGAIGNCFDALTGTDFFSVVSGNFRVFVTFSLKANENIGVLYSSNRST